MPYLTPDQILNRLNVLVHKYPNLCDLIIMPRSVEGRAIHAVKITASTGGDSPAKPRVLIIAGVHGREWAPPDALISFVEELLDAYKRSDNLVEQPFVYTRPGTAVPLQYETYIVDKAKVQDIVEKLETWVIPMVNPDGRDFSLTTEAMWRKNRKQAQIWQLLDVSGQPTGGTYTLTYYGNPAPVAQTTAPIPFNADAPTVERALELLTNVGKGNVEARNVGDHIGILVHFKKGGPLMTAASALSGGSNPTATVQWGDGVDINRNYDIAWKKEVYYSVAGEVGVSGAKDPLDRDAFDDYRGTKIFSEVETVNIKGLIEKNDFDYFLDIHSCAGIILLPWAIDTAQSSVNDQWFGNKGWDRHLLQPGRPGLTANTYREWFPKALRTAHHALGSAMQAEIKRAAGQQPAAQDASQYDVAEDGAAAAATAAAAAVAASAAAAVAAVLPPSPGLYLATGTGMDYAFGRQFLPPHVVDGDNKFAVTLEAGSDLDGGFFPVESINQYKKVERDIHGGIVGLLLKAIA